MSELQTLPDNLPVPENDGACDHLPGMTVPDVTLPSTAGRDVPLRDLAKERTVLYCYLMTGRPDRASPDGWETIPGARGCTPETCAFRDHHEELRGWGADVFGLSTQSTDYQREMVARLHLPFEVLSDADLGFARALELPTFEVDGVTLIKRLTLVLSDRRVEHVFYPVFPPDAHAREVVGWLESHTRA